MNYIKYFFLLIVVFASTAYAPRVFAVSNILVTGTLDVSGAFFCDEPPYDGVSNFSSYRLGLYPEHFSIHQTTTTGTGICDGALNPHLNIGGDPDWNGEDTVVLTMYPGSAFGVDDFGYAIFYHVQGDGTNLGDWSMDPDGGTVGTTSKVLTVFPEDGVVISPGTYQFQNDIWVNQVASPYATSFIWVYENLDLEYQPAPLHGEFFQDGFTSVISPQVVLSPGAYVLTSSFFNVTDNQFWYATTTGFIVSTSYSTTTINQISDIVDILRAEVNLYCNPVRDATGFFGLEVNPDWDFAQCIRVLVVPDSTAFNILASTLKDSVLNRFPIGYATDFVSIISSTATSSLVLLDFTVPPGIPGTGAHFSFDIANSLDFVLNATTSTFNNSSATSTETLFEITDRYWRILVYIGVGLYILRRIFGSHIIPNTNNKEKII